MNLPDLINGMFEGVGAVFCVLNVFAIRRDKSVKGIHWLPTSVFSAWGIWNLYYYAHLDQWLSWSGGVLMVTVNLTWLAHALFYATRSPKSC